jgi:hypothetical protein
MRGGECREYLRKVSSDINAARQAACYVARIRGQMVDLADRKFPWISKIGGI